MFARAKSGRKKKKEELEKRDKNHENDDIPYQLYLRSQERHPEMSVTELGKRGGEVRGLNLF